MKTRNGSVGDRTEATTSDDEDPCLKCKKGGGENWIQCDICDGWFHDGCSGLPVDLLPNITKAKLMLFRCLICFNKKTSLPSVEKVINTIKVKFPVIIEKAITESFKGEAVVKSMPTNPKTEPRSVNSSSSKNLEIKLNGIPELTIEPGQHSSVKRVELDEKHLGTILELIDELDKSSLACVKRLGPFEQDAPRPRSLLVTFKNV